MNKTELLNEIIKAGDKGWKDWSTRGSKQYYRSKVMISKLRKKGFKIKTVRAAGGSLYFYEYPTEELTNKLMEAAYKAKEAEARFLRNMLIWTLIILILIICVNLAIR